MMVASSIRRIPYFEVLVVTIGAILGAAVVRDISMAFALWISMMGLLALTAPAGSWAFGAVLFAILLRGAITLGLLPSLMTFVDIPLAWGALLVGLMGAERIDAFTKRVLLLLGMLATTIAISWAFHPTEAARPLLYLLLLGEPFALFAGLLLDPPGPRLTRALKGLLIATVAIQVPIGFFQFLTMGVGGGKGNLDKVQGTLFGAGAGHTAMAAVVIVGAIWLLSGRSTGLLGRTLLAIPLFALVFVADAKQVLFALPVTILGFRLKGNAGQTLVRVVAVGVAFFAVLNLYEPGRVALTFIQEAAEERGGKLAAADLLVEHMSQEPTSVVFGMGPATTISRASFMTTDLFLKEESPLRAFGLKPSVIAMEAHERAIATTTAESSFNSATSSALGVFGDIGVVGISVYLSMLVVLILALRRIGTPMASAAAAGWAMFGVLGFVFDWWEQPPLAVFLAVLSGIAVAESKWEKAA